MHGVDIIVEMKTAAYLLFVSPLSFVYKSKSYRLFKEIVLQGFFGKAMLLFGTRSSI